MDSSHTPSSPPAEDAQENPQSNEDFQADESFRAAPNTFQFPGPAPANPFDANAPRLGPNELDLDNDPYAELYDPGLNQMWQRQTRTRRARSLDISPTRRNPDGEDDTFNIFEPATTRRYDGINPQEVQQTSLEHQLAQVGNYNYLPLPTSVRGVGSHGQVPRGADRRSNVTPRTSQTVRGNAIPRTGRRPINPDAYVPPQNFPSYMAERPTRSVHQLEQDAATYHSRHPQQIPRPQAVGGLFTQAQRRPQIPGPPQYHRAQQAGASMVPPGDVVRWMQNSQPQVREGNVTGASYGAQIPQGYPPQDPRLPLGSYPAANVGRAIAAQGSVLPGQSTQRNSNRRPAPSNYGETGSQPDFSAMSAQQIAEYIQSRNVRPQRVPTGALRPVRRDSPRRTPPRHGRIGEEATERTRKRRRQVEDESNDESIGDSLLEAETRRQADDDEEDEDDEDDEDEDQSEPVKKSSRSVKPAKKKAKSSSKKSAGPKAQPSKRAPKIRIDHGELVQRADGTFWFRANDTASWEPTVRHEPNRAAMLADARRDPADLNGPDRAYDVAPRAGPEAHNRTSYLEAHRHWYCRKPHDWHHETLDPIFYRFQRGNRPFRDNIVGPLRWRGHVVLNNDNEVITGWPDMPLTVSTRIEGWRLEAISRLDERISAADFRDRMPSRTNRAGDRAPQGASALGNHRSRFREENGLASWDARDGTSGFTEAIKSRLTDEQRANNSTQGFTRLSPASIRKVREENKKKSKGTFAKRAGHKRLSDKERAARAAGEKPTRTPMSSRPAKKTKKAKEAQADEPSSDPEAPLENSHHPSSEDGEHEEEDEGTGYDPDPDNSTT